MPKVTDVNAADWGKELNAQGMPAGLHQTHWSNCETADEREGVNISRFEPKGGEEGGSVKEKQVQYTIKSKKLDYF